MRDINIVFMVVLFGTISADFMFSTPPVAQQASLDLQEKCAGPKGRPP
jgi:hypothetical protein